MALDPTLRERVGKFVEQDRVQNVILALILFNAVTLGLETSPVVMREAGALLYVLDKVVLTVFVVELALRIFAHGARFFRDPWSLFDTLVVGIALMPATGQFSILRSLRVLRVLRVLSIVPSMRRVVGSLIAAIPGLLSIGLVLLIIYYVFAVIATKLFGAEFPDWFGTVGRSLYTLFQVMTLESWSMGISRPVMEKFPYAWAFFVPFILLATFTMLNLFIAVIVNAMQSFSEAEHKDTLTAVDDAREHIESDLRGELRALRGEIAELKKLSENARTPDTVFAVFGRDGRSAVRAPGTALAFGGIYSRRYAVYGRMVGFDGCHINTTRSSGGSCESTGRAQRSSRRARREACRGWSTVPGASRGSEGAPSAGPCESASRSSSSCALGPRDYRALEVGVRRTRVLRDFSRTRWRGSSDVVRLLSSRHVDRCRRVRPNRTSIARLLHLARVGRVPRARRRVFSASASGDSAMSTARIHSASSEGVGDVHRASRRMRSIAALRATQRSHAFGSCGRPKRQACIARWSAS
jgi:voltage-gated sodium channel